MAATRELLERCRLSGAASAVCELVSLRIGEQLEALERAPMERVQRIQGRIEALRELLGDLNPRGTR